MSVFCVKYCHVVNVDSIMRWEHASQSQPICVVSIHIIDWIGRPAPKRRCCCIEEKWDHVGNVDSIGVKAHSQSWWTRAPTECRPANQGTGRIRFLRIAPLFDAVWSHNHLPVQPTFVTRSGKWSTCTSNSYPVGRFFVCWNFFSINKDIRIKDEMDQSLWRMRRAFYFGNTLWRRFEWLARR